MISDTSYSEKIGKFFDLCDDDRSGTIDKKEFYGLLKLIFDDYDEKKKLKQYVKEIFEEYDYDGSGCLDREEMVDACVKDWRIKNLIETTFKRLKNLEKWIDRDFSRKFTTKISFTAGTIRNKNINSVDHLRISRLTNAF